MSERSFQDTSVYGVNKAPAEYAFPCVTPPACSDGHSVPFGLTKREWMATMIMAGLWAHEGDKDHSYEGAAQTVVEQADALLAELAK